MVRQAADRDVGLDVARAMAIVMVVLAHTAREAMPSTEAGGSVLQTVLAHPGAPVYDVLAHPAVPLFLMCSGALMLRRDIPLKRLFGHNLARIAAALAVWALAYRIWRLPPGGLTPAGLWQTIVDILLFRHEDHLYYLQVLILVYAAIPIARAFVRNASRREAEYLLGFWFVTGILFPLLRYFPPFSLMFPVVEWYRMNTAYSAIGYTVLGWYLKEYGSAIPSKWYWLAGSAGLTLSFGGTAVIALTTGTLSNIFLEGMSPGPMLMAFGLFGLTANRRQWPAFAEKLSARLARSSFCIYLAHIFVIELESPLIKAAGSNLSMVTIPLSVLAVIIPCCLCWEVLRRIPLVKTWLI